MWLISFHSFSLVYTRLSDVTRQRDAQVEVEENEVEVEEEELIHAELEMVVEEEVEEDEVKEDELEESGYNKICFFLQKITQTSTEPL